MSVVNQMLKDLAKRSQTAPMSETVFTNVLKNMAEHKPNHNRSIKIFAILSLVFLFLIILAIISSPIIKRHPPLEVTTTPQEKIVPMTNAMPESNDTASLTLLDAISFEVQNEMTNISLLLNTETLYRLNMPKPDQLQIILENTKLETSIPKINTLNSAIQAMNMQNNADGNLIINLRLRAGTELALVNLNTGTKSSELQVDLKYKEAINPNIQTTTEEVPVVHAKSPKFIKTISPEVSSQDEFQQAVNFATEGQNDTAASLLTKILERDPGFVPARKLLATLWLENGNTDKAESIVQAGLSQTPHNPMFLQLKAQILMSLGKSDQALELLQQNPPPLTEYPEYHALMAALLQQMGKSSYAAALYDRLLKIQPQNAIWWLGLAIAKESLDKKYEAYEAYAKANTENISPELKAYIDTRMSSLQG